MPNEDKPLPFTIAEDTNSADDISVTLDDHETPFGMPRKHQIFMLGGENERDLIRLPGRQTPIIHTKFTAWAPTIIKGHLRDTFMLQKLGGPAAQDVVNQLMNILDRQRQVKLTCGLWVWKAFPKRFHLPVEGTGDFTYELEFDILKRPGQREKPPNDSLLDPFPYDAVADARNLLAADRLALQAQQVALAEWVALDAALDAVDAALDTAMAAAQAFENSDPTDLGPAQRMSSSAQTAKVSCDAAYAIVAAMAAEEVLADPTEDQIAVFEVNALGMADGLDQIKVTMRSLQYAAGHRINSAA
jgi:hypothetical protein